ncbi:MAG: YbaK/EbsC family protein [Thiohalocapsa sp.]|jgi:Ala-tRNA(Pro) deacylase|uniref:aminoacyl-tRNA deacylase n=1 Tax=Thiohalocapsa sp. TaxID=2497641 RepID=UPI0025D148F2|nr:YbaK/EbsC family protein [Thiohalocapsa sp.]MCG6940207.1 YbaK/EbsC family protein [Thiohalocapsa sp.]
MSIAARVERRLGEQQVPYELLPHKTTGSTHETASAAHVPEDHIAKAVMLHDGHAPAMAVIPGDTWLHLDALNTDTGRTFRLDDEPELAELLPDCAIGAVPPLGPVYGIETFLDEALTTLAEVYFESGDHQNLVKVSSEDFLKLLPGARRGHYGHRE